MSLKNLIRQHLRRLGYDIVRTDLVTPERSPPGHFYSVIPSLTDISGRASTIFCRPDDALPGISLNLEAQLEILRSFQKLEAEHPFYVKDGRKRFNIDNETFSYDDAPILHYMMRQLSPKKS